MAHTITFADQNGEIVTIVSNKKNMEAARLD